MRCLAWLNNLSFLEQYQHTLVPFCEFLRLPPKPLTEWIKVCYNTDMRTTTKKGIWSRLVRDYPHVAAEVQRQLASYDYTYSEVVAYIAEKTDGRYIPSKSAVQKWAKASGSAGEVAQ